MNITRICPFTNRVNVRRIEGATRRASPHGRTGALIQDALPEVSPEDREFIMTGITPSMWNHIFGEGA